MQKHQARYISACALYRDDQKTSADAELDQKPLGQLHLHTQSNM